MVAKVSIIILTFNSEKYIEELIKSIYEHNTSGDFEIIIVDNASQDETLKKVQSLKLKIKNYSSNFKVIESKDNVGFARGINIGAKEARGEYLLLINPDTEWRGGSVDGFISTFENDNNVGVVGGKILAKDGTAEKSAGKFLKTAEVFLTTLSLDEALGVRFSPNKRQEVDFVSGGFMAVRRDLFNRLGGFDESLFIYVEDMEFCYRVKKESMKVLFDTSVEIVHEGHGSSNRGFAIENIYRGLLYFQKKHGNFLSYNSVKLLLKSKAFALVLLGKIINNKYLTETYSEALKA